MPDTLLAASGVSKRYNGVLALADVHLTLYSGEVHALMGENGAGKSTLIKILAGVTPADALDVRVRGRPARLHTPADARRSGLRFIHQELNVVPGLSVAENIFLGRPYPRRLGVLVDWPRLHRRAAATLARLGVTHLAPTRPLSQLSPGDAMLVSIARAFVEQTPEEAPEDPSEAVPQRPLIYVMDEPTAALSRSETDLLFGVIRGLRARGCAVLYVSHRIEEIFAISDRITVLRDGRVVATTATEDATPALLIRQMTGRSLEVAYPARQRDRSQQPALQIGPLHSKQVSAPALRFSKGEIVGVAGLAGSGRSELLRALAGVDPALIGEVRLEGRAVSLASPSRAWREGVAFVPEERRSQGLVMTASARVNMTLPHLERFARGGVLTGRRRERLFSEQLAEQVRLRARSPEQVVHTLSGGNQQKVVLARALAGHPNVLLLDEPTRGVDVAATSEIYTLIQQAADRGVVVLMASSDLLELLGMPERIFVMNRRRLVGDVPSAGLDEAALLTLCYGEAAA